MGQLTVLRVKDMNYVVVVVIFDVSGLFLSKIFLLKSCEVS
ncbi:hypothetical protein TRICHSKD4_0284 [Roseibium sp. TrichSKD4]|nr:hypothetical protein TRICHSKD4_0284 [Roseibium sp. TrichSKD4]